MIADTKPGSEVESKQAATPDGLDEHARLQRDHYDSIIENYEAHYDDHWSQVYRRKFIYDPMFQGVEFKGSRVLEAMCGSGQATGYLQEAGASVHGLDLSGGAIDRFANRFPGVETSIGSVLNMDLPDASFDTVVIIGGLHHVPDQLDEALGEVARVLKPGGYFGFMEPHAGSLPDLARQLWYRGDNMFEEGERAIDVDKLAAAHASTFEVVRRKYFGTVAYLSVLNSMIFRVPPKSKRLYAPTAMLIERAISPLCTRWTSCIATALWRKR